MTPEELDLLQEELEEYLPTSLQVKLGKLFDLVRNAKEDPIRYEWVQNQRKILNNQSKGMWDSFFDWPEHYHKKTTKKLDENQVKTREEPDKNYGLSA